MPHLCQVQHSAPDCSVLTCVEANGLVHQAFANWTLFFLERLSALETTRLMAAWTKGNLHRRTYAISYVARFGDV